MVHQMMPTNINPAPRASSNNSVMKRLLARLAMVCIVGTLAACTSAPLRPPVPPSVQVPLPGMRAAPADLDRVAALVQPRSRWVPAAWSDLPGFAEDSLFEAWNAWIRSCERPVPVQAKLCSEVRRNSIADPQEQRDWLQERMQPYRVESLQGESAGLLTGYFEPVLEASRVLAPGFTVPLYQAPAQLAQRKPWFSRKEIDTLPEAQAALQGRVIGYLADPVDALILQTQGSGRLRLEQPDGTSRWVRLAFAGSNEHPFRSAGRWLLDQGLVKDASWAGIKAWLANNPQRQQELLWSNPRVVFFREERIDGNDAVWGPRGAQGVALTPGRSIAVDPGSIPYGTPVWLASQGTQVQLQKLVLAQDTGQAITGAVRADYFTGWGPQAADLAGRLRQPLQMWVLWPK
ncbi:MAG: MltA domain-containing protein [Rhodoferax sp.]|nr:MltA domain-containing protein [Rhodoferax sp.]